MLFRSVFAQGLGPAEHQRVAQADLTADMQHVAVAIGQRQVSTIYTQLNQYHVVIATKPAMP